MEACMPKRSTGCGWVLVGSRRLVLDAVGLSVAAPQVKQVVWSSQSLPSQHQPHGDKECSGTSGK